MGELAPRPIDLAYLTREDRLFFAARGLRVQGITELALFGETDKISDWEIFHSNNRLVEKVCAEALKEWELADEDVSHLIVEAGRACAESGSNEQA